MKKVIKINKSGFFVEDVILNDTDTIPEDCVIFPCPDGFYLPKWDGENWVEGGAVPLDQLKQSKITEIKAICNAEILAGFESFAKGSPAWYGLDYEDQINMEALKNNVALGIIPDGSLEYYAKGQPCESWSNAEFLALYSDAMTFKTLRIRKAKTLIVQVEASQTKEGIEATAW